MLVTSSKVIYIEAVTARKKGVTASYFLPMYLTNCAICTKTGQTSISILWALSMEIYRKVCYTITVLGDNPKTQKGDLKMIILATNSTVGINVVINEKDFYADRKKYYAYFGGGFYDPRNDFRPCLEGAEGRRRLYDKYADNFRELLPEADAKYEALRADFTKNVEKAAETKSEPSVPAGSLGTQLETIMLQVLAEQSTDKVLNMAKPMIEKHIIETFGALPQKHEIKTPTATKVVTGTVHERFDTVLNLVNADIPVFLTGAAGTGKNVLCKQIAEAMDLEFFFTNAVTQEYKLTGFIDANGTFHETQFYKAFTEGGLFMLDEMDASIPEVLIILNAAIANRYFDFPTGRVDAHENFRLIAAGNTFGTGADMEYSGRFQLDAASLDRFALVEIDYSEAVEKAITNGNSELIDFVHAFRDATRSAGIKHLATYRSMERICKLESVMDLKETLKICLLKSLPIDDMRILVDNMRNGLSATNKYFLSMKQICA